MASKVTLDSLPSEILLDILRYAILQPSHRPRKNVNISAIAVVSKAIYTACAALIYRSVVLHTPRALVAFARTADARPTLLAANVKSFAFTFDKVMRPDLRIALGVALRPCANLHTLVLPGAALSGLVLPPSPFPMPAPKHVTFSSWGDIATIHAAHSTQPTAYPVDLFRETTHLSVAGPPAVWARPCDILHALGDPQYLTHLCFARRTSGNVDNDAEFVSDVLALRARIRCVVVSMCTNAFLGNIAEPADEQSVFECAVREMGMAVREGHIDEWKRAWANVELGTHASGLEERYWADL
jgi:hypothetical protein